MIRSRLARLTAAVVMIAGPVVPAVVTADALPAAAASCNLSNDHWQTVWGNKDAGTVAYILIRWTADPCHQAARVSGTWHSLVTGGTTSKTSGEIHNTGIDSEVDGPVAWPQLAGSRQLSQGPWVSPWRAPVTVCAPCGGARKG